MDNIRKVITYLLSDSFSEVILVGGSILAGLPLPILPVQILWVNIIEDSLPNIALAFEPEESDIMDFPPKKKKDPLITKEMKFIIFFIGIITDFFLFALFFYLLNSDYSLEHIRTMIFATLAIDSLFYVYSCKSLRKPFWKSGIWNNRLLIASQIFGILMIFIAIYVPFFSGILSTVFLNFWDWMVIGGIGILNVILVEIAKHYFIKRHQFN